MSGYKWNTNEIREKWLWFYLSFDNWWDSDTILKPNLLIQVHSWLGSQGVYLVSCNLCPEARIWNLCSWAAKVTRTCIARPNLWRDGATFYQKHEFTADFCTVKVASCGTRHKTIFIFHFTLQTLVFHFWNTLFYSLN